MVLAKPMKTFNANGEFRSLRASQRGGGGSGLGEGDGKAPEEIDFFVDVAKRPSARRGISVIIGGVDYISTLL